MYKGRKSINVNLKRDHDVSPPNQKKLWKKSNRCEVDIYLIVLKKDQMKFSGTIIVMPRVPFKNLKTTIVSFGFDCNVAIEMRHHKIRKEAFPFDWVVSPPDMMIEMIQTDFLGWLEYENLKSYSAESRRTISKVDVVDVKTKCIYMHDFDDLVEDFTAVKDKYNRRILRLLDLLNGNKHVTFVIDRCSRLISCLIVSYLMNMESHLNYKIMLNLSETEVADKLTMVLDQKYPNLNYSIASIDAVIHQKKHLNSNKIIPLTNHKLSKKQIKKYTKNAKKRVLELKRKS